MEDIKRILEETKIEEPTTNETVEPLIVATSHSAGHEMISAEDVKLYEGDRKFIKTNHRIAKMKKGYYLQLRAKSGLSKQGLDIMAGVIDADFKDYIRVGLCNNGNKMVAIKKGQPIAQAILQKYEHFDNATVAITGAFEHTGWGSTTKELEEIIAKNESQQIEDN